MRFIVRGAPRILHARSALHGAAASLSPQGNTSLAGGYGIRPYGWVQNFNQMPKTALRFSTAALHSSLFTFLHPFADSLPCTGYRRFCAFPFGEIAPRFRRRAKTRGASGCVKHPFAGSLPCTGYRRFCAFPFGEIAAPISAASKNAGRKRMRKASVCASIPHFSPAVKAFYADLGIV